MIDYDAVQAVGELVKALRAATPEQLREVFDVGANQSYNSGPAINARLEAMSFARTRLKLIAPDFKSWQTRAVNAAIAAATDAFPKHAESGDLSLLWSLAENAAAAVLAKPVLKPDAYLLLVQPLLNIHPPLASIEGAGTTEISNEAIKEATVETQTKQKPKPTPKQKIKKAPAHRAEAKPAEKKALPKPSVTPTKADTEGKVFVEKSAEFAKAHATIFELFKAQVPGYAIMKAVEGLKVPAAARQQVAFQIMADWFAEGNPRLKKLTRAQLFWDSLEGKAVAELGQASLDKSPSRVKPEKSEVAKAVESAEESAVNEDATVEEIEAEEAAVIEDVVNASTEEEEVQADPTDPSSYATNPNLPSS